MSTRLIELSDELEELVAKAAPGVVALEHNRGNGTGLVLAHDGYVLTNAHVARGARTIGVRFHDGQTAQSTVVGADDTTDLAVLRVARSGLTSLPLAELNRVRVGQMVVAMGHPFGFERSVSLGVVSALERRLPGRDGAVLDGLIQTDAAINPGNSGGPLVNARCEVVGINTAMLPFAQGIGFAVPSTTASWVGALLMQHGEIRRRYLGIAARNEALTPELAAEVGQPRGIRVMQIGRDTPASTGGLREEDLVIAVNGRAVATVDDLQRLMATDKTSEVEVVVWRKGRKQEAKVRPFARDRRAA
jgi:serine protease Do